jgi:hypothetical protein
VRAELLQEQLGDARVLTRRDVVRRAALQDRAAEAPARFGRAEQRADAHRAGRLAEDRDVLGIAAEVRDVLVHPVERGGLVAQHQVRVRVLAAGDEIAQRERAQRAQAVVQGHDDGVAARRQARAVVERRAARADQERAAVDEDQHRAASAVRGRGPHVQVEAVLVLPVRAAHEAPHQRVLGARLRGAGAEAQRLALAAPRLRGLRRAEAQRPDRRLRVRNAAERDDAAAARAAHSTRTRLGDLAHGASRP